MWFLLFLGSGPFETYWLVPGKCVAAPPAGIYALAVSGYIWKDLANGWLGLEGFSHFLTLG